MSLAASESGTVYSLTSSTTGKVRRDVPRVCRRPALGDEQAQTEVCRFEREQLSVAFSPAAGFEIGS